MERISLDLIELEGYVYCHVHGEVHGEVADPYVIGEDCHDHHIPLFVRVADYD